MPHRYHEVKKFNLFKEKKEPGSKKPDYGNSKVELEVSLEPGRYSFSGWQYEDTGNIGITIQRVEEDAGSGGGFDD
jgi:hypothetical protein|nr:hypothetical protein [uncultured Mediterranean phage uvMED]